MILCGAATGHHLKTIHTLKFKQMATNKKIENTLAILALICLFLFGFIIGKQTTSSKPVIEYVKGETITRLIPYTEFIPVKVYEPRETIYIDSIEYLISSIDTAKLIAEYIKTKHYEQVLFDIDTLGKMQVNLSIAYNSLRSLDYQFTPIIKQITTIKQQMYTPFLSSSVNSFGTVGFGGGLYMKNIGYQAKYITNFQKQGFEVGLNYKF